MPRDRHVRLEAELKALFEEEHKALLAGDFETLSSSLKRKDRLVTALRQSTPDEKSLSSLRDAARTNAARLSAFADGLRASLRRIEALQGGGPAIRSYDTRGDTKDIAAPRASLHRNV